MQENVISPELMEEVNKEFATRYSNLLNLCDLSRRNHISHDTAKGHVIFVDPVTGERYRVHPENQDVIQQYEVSEDENKDEIIDEMNTELTDIYLPLVTALHMLMRKGEGATIAERIVADLLDASIRFIAEERRLIHVKETNPDAHEEDSEFEDISRNLLLRGSLVLTINRLLNQVMGNSISNIEYELGYINKKIADPELPIEMRSIGEIANNAFFGTITGFFASPAVEECNEIAKQFTASLTQTIQMAKEAEKANGNSNPTEESKESNQ